LSVVAPSCEYCWTTGWAPGERPDPAWVPEKTRAMARMPAAPNTRTELKTEPRESVFLTTIR
jgi:hypothetical protein